MPQKINSTDFLPSTPQWSAFCASEKGVQKKQKPDTPNTSGRRRAFKRGLWAEASARRALRAKRYRLPVRNFRHPPGEVAIIVRRGRISVLSRSNFAPIVMWALMLFRRPCGDASPRALPDLSYAI